MRKFRSYVIKQIYLCLRIWILLFYHRSETVKNDSERHFRKLEERKKNDFKNIENDEKSCKIQFRPYPSSSI